MQVCERGGRMHILIRGDERAQGDERASGGSGCGGRGTGGGRGGGTEMMRMSRTPRTMRGALRDGRRKTRWRRAGSDNSQTLWIVGPGRNRDGNECRMG
jgi:hypothetical protein